MNTDFRVLSHLLQEQQASPQGRKALLFAIGVEILLAVLLLWESGQHKTIPPAAMPPMQLQLISERKTPVVPPKPVAIPLPKRPPPKPMAKPTPQPQARPQPVPTPIKQTLPPSLLPSPVQAPPAPSAVPPPPAPPSPPNPAIEAEYLARVKGAIQSAVRFPDSAKMLGQGGRVQVEFHLQNGLITALRIFQKGSMDSFNNAAMAAVREAHLPPIPVELRGKSFTLELWVEFVLHDNE